VQIRKIAPSAAGDKNLAARLFVVFEQHHAPPALSGHGRAHQPCRSRAQNNYIELAQGGGHRFWLRI
jgi:hypothetical protein